MYYEASASGVAYAAIYCVGTHVLAIGCIAAFLLLWIGPGRSVLTHFEPVGRLALSNYLFQTACIVLLLYSPGFGLALTLPVWASLPIGLAIFAVQRAGERAVGRAPPLRPRRVGMAADDVRRRVRARQSLTLCSTSRLSGMWPSGSGLSSSR